MKSVPIDEELEAIGIIIHAIESLDEQQRIFVLRTVIERLGVSLQIKNSGGNAGSGADDTSAPNSLLPGSGSGNGSLDAQTPKQFLRTKLPKTDVQRIACLAYYLTHVRNQPHFKGDDLAKLNTDGGAIRFSNLPRTINNAMLQNGFLSPVGGGKKQITAIGEDLVDALPDQEAAKRALKVHRKPRRYKKAAANSK